MKKVTVADVVKWEACYPKDRIKALWDGDDWKTPLEILDFNIPPEDRLWAVLREEVIPAPYLRWLACHWAEQCLLHECESGREIDERSWRAVVVAKRHAQGLASAAELAAVWPAADSARSAAGAIAAWFAADSARSAAGSEPESAMVAAVSAAESVAYAARSGSGSESVRAATYEAIIECVRVMINWLEEHDELRCDRRTR